MSAAAVPPVAAAAIQAFAQSAPPAMAPPVAGPSFGQVLIQGLESVDRRVANADALVRAFTLNGDVPIHQVTFALEEARLSVELMMQFRARLVESYQRMMEMQL
jgi:flagellar hook-basal body complex protein FliE